MTKKILLLGEDSYAAKGLYEKMTASGYDVECFSKGSGGKNGAFIKGDVFALNTNKDLSQSYDIVINFILIKDSGVEQNIEFIKQVDELCRVKNVKNLFQISSMSNYPNKVNCVDENTNIESNYSNKGSYASIKVAVDNYLTNKNKSYQLSFVRPGFIYLNGIKPNFSGIGIKLAPSICLLLGNKKTSLPIIERSRLHKGIIKAVSSACIQSTYLMFENNNTTKHSFLKKYGFKLIIPLNKTITITLANFLKTLRIFTKNQIIQVKGLFRIISYECYNTEYKLGYSFLKNSVCIIGAGTFGSYIADLLCKQHPDVNITIVEVGNSNVRNEEEIGYKTNILKDNYIGTAKGRFFGYGGASDKWGGQLLMFTKNDFESPNNLLNDIIKLNIKYREAVFRKFKITTLFDEKYISKDFFIKTGVWLGYLRRNLFKFFKVDKLRNVKILSGTRTTRLIRDGEKISGIEVIRDGKIFKIRFNRYFLTSGAFESNRILLNSGVVDNNKIHFSDHLSKKMFKIKETTQIGDIDFAFKVNGSSLITKRLVGEIDNVSYYVHPSFNSEFLFFQNLKALLFKREFTISLIKSVFKDMPSILGFAWSVFVKKKIYVYKNQWDLYVDIENSSKDCNIALSKDKDRFGEKAIDLTFKIDEKTDEIFQKINMLVKAYLRDNCINFEEYTNDASVQKCEDTYHPYAMVNDVNSIQEYYDLFENLLVVNTGILPRAGGINTAAAIFPIIEEYFQQTKIVE